jgi:hypothetical protein
MLLHLQPIRLKRMVWLVLRVDDNVGVEFEEGEALLRISFTPSISPRPAHSGVRVLRRVLFPLP